MCLPLADSLFIIFFFFIVIIVFLIWEISKVSELFSLSLVTFCQSMRFFCFSGLLPYRGGVSVTLHGIPLVIHIADARPGVACPRVSARLQVLVRAVLLADVEGEGAGLVEILE